MFWADLPRLGSSIYVDPMHCCVKGHFLWWLSFGIVNPRPVKTSAVQLIDLRPIVQQAKVADFTLVEAYGRVAVFLFRTKCCGVYQDSGVLVIVYRSLQRGNTLASHGMHVHACF